MGALFFWCSLLTAASYLAAPFIARRIGLINTMVLTHLPSNVCLIAMVFAPNLTTVIILLLLRSLLSQDGRAEAQLLCHGRGHFAREAGRGRSER